MIISILSASPTVTLFYPGCSIHFVQVLVELPFSGCLNRGQVISYGFADKLNFVQVYSNGSNRCKQFSTKWKKIGIFYIWSMWKYLAFCMLSILLFEHISYIQFGMLYLIESLCVWGGEDLGLFYWFICFLVSFNIFLLLYDVLLLEDCISLNH